ncbi:MAG: amidohydrolase family protein, partial [Anaerolineae bacterium]
MMECEATRQNGPRSVDLVVEAGWVLTMDREDRVIQDGAVAVEGKHIVAVGPREEILRGYQARLYLGGRHQILMPGLVDPYGHAGHGLIKGIYHPERGWPTNPLYFHATDEGWWYAEGLLSAVERLR